MKLVSIPDLKVFMEKTDTAHDALLGTLTDQVSRRIEAWLNRKLVKESRTEYFDAGRMRYFLPAYPFDLTEAFTVKYDGVLYTKNTDYFIWLKEAMVEWYWMPTYYKPQQIEITWTGGYVESPISEVTGTDNKVYRCTQSHVASVDNMPVTGPNYETYWTEAGTTGGTWTNGAEYLDHSYLSGAPEDLALAASLQISHVFRRRKDVGLTSVSYPDGSKTFDTSSNAYRPKGRSNPPFIPEVADILKSYRKVPTDR